MYEKFGFRRIGNLQAGRKATRMSFSARNWAVLDETSPPRRHRSRTAHCACAEGVRGNGLAIRDRGLCRSAAGRPVRSCKRRTSRRGDPTRRSTRFFADGPFDLVLIGSPNHLHYEHLLAAFEAGFPIFCEKPIVRTEDETFALARHLSARKTPPLYIGLVMRSMPIVREVIARVDQGAARRTRLARHDGASAARAWRLSRAQLAAQAGMGRLLHARQGLPRFRYFRAAGRRAARTRRKLRRTAHLSRRTHAMSAAPIPTANRLTRCVTQAGARPTMRSSPTWTSPITRRQSSTTRTA